MYPRSRREQEKEDSQREEEKVLLEYDARVEVGDIEEKRSRNG